MTPTPMHLLDRGWRGAQEGVATRAGLRRLLYAPPPVATSRALSLIAGLFYVSGGLIAVTIAATQSDAGLIMLLGAIAVVAGLALAGFPDSIPVAVHRAMNFIGTGLILLAVLLAGPDSNGHALFWVFCFALLDAFLFFPWQWALPMFGWLLMALSAATFGWHVVPVREWAVVVVVLSVAAFAIGWLVQFAADGVWDPILDMLNRRGFERELESRCSTGSLVGRRFSIATVTLSGSTWGSAATFRDRNQLTMSRLAAIWHDDTPTVATWAHMGDAEFAVVWDDSAGLDQYLDQVRRRAAAVHPVSIGASDFRPGQTATELLTEAANGSTLSERHGGDRVTWAGLMNEQVEELRAAIDLGQVVPYYQPVVDLRTGETIGAEALARWVHPQRGTVPPDEFIPLAEQSGLIHALGLTILAQACADAASWNFGRPESGCPQRVYVAVNVSGVQLRDSPFANYVARCLKDTGLPASSLILEVTESTVAADDPLVWCALGQLRQSGVSIAMDDFGTGYSNMARLANVPIDILKVDRSFVRQLDGPGQARALVQAVLELASRIGLRTVVEGLEETEHADFVARCGAHFGQGWLFGRPVPGPELGDQLKGLSTPLGPAWSPPS